MVKNNTNTIHGHTSNNNNNIYNNDNINNNDINLSHRHAYTQDDQTQLIKRKNTIIINDKNLLTTNKPINQYNT